MIKGILFDKDGTLFDFNASWGRWARGFIDNYTRDESKRRDLAVAFQFDYDKSEFLPSSPIIAGTGQEIFSAVQSVFPDDSAAEIADKIRFSTQEAVMEPVCDLRVFLNDLKARGLKLGVATNDSEAGARRHLEREGVIELFDYIAGCDSGYGAKPDAGMCQGFLKAFGLAGPETAMVGDSGFDIMAGKGADMVTIGVETGAASLYELGSADLVMPDITGILGWLGEQNNR